MKKLLFGLLGLLVTISGWSAETNSGPISSVTVAGLVAQNGTPTPNTPVDIVSNNGVVKASKNLFDRAKQSTDYYYNNSGGEASTTYSGVKFVHSAKIPCKPNTQYVLSGTRNLSGDQYYYKFTFWDKNGDFISYVNNDPVQPGNYVRNVTTPNNCYYIAFNSFANDTNVQLEQGSTATPYMPYGQIYTDGTVETIADSANHTATVATLLGIGDYRDTQNINTGAITRNVGVKVLDGTESYTFSSTYGNALLISVASTYWRADKTKAPLCTHYTGTVFSDSRANFTCGFNASGHFYIRQNDFTSSSASSFKQWLAEQYANGTPVTIIYPLATATTESVAGQTMTMAPVSNKTGGVTGMTITTLLSSGTSVVTTIATNAIKIATTAYNSARFSPVVTELNTTIATIRDVVTNTINQTKAIADLQATKQTRPDENCPAGKKCLLVETEENGVIVPHWYEIIENAE